MKFLSDVFQNNQIDIIIKKMELFGLLLLVLAFFTIFLLVESADLIYDQLSQVLCSRICVHFAALMFFFAYLFDD